MVTSRSTSILEYLVFGLKPEAPDAIRNPYYVAARAGKSETLEFTTEDEDFAAGSRKALQRLAEAVVEDAYLRASTRPDFKISSLDIVFSFTPPYAARVRGIYRDAAFPLGEESQKMFSAYVENAYTLIDWKMEQASKGGYHSPMPRQDGGRRGTVVTV